MKYYLDALLISIICLFEISTQIDIFYHPSFLQTVESSKINNLETGEKIFQTKCFVITEDDKPDEKVKEYNSNLVFASDSIHIIQNKQNIKNITYFEYIFLI
jgi:hypothetical protein